MTSRVESVFQPGQTLYVVIHDPALDKVWNPTLNAGAGAWETYNNAHWIQYAIPMTEQAGSGYYTAAYPAGIVNVLTSEAIFQQGGGTPALGDGALGLGQSQGANLAAVAGDAAQPAKLQASLSSMIIATVQAGANTASAILTDLPDVVDNVYQGRVALFTSGGLIREAGTIISYTALTQTLTFSAPFTSAPVAGDKLVIV